MRPVRLFAIAALLVLVSSPPANAEVLLSFGDGRASLRATNATMAEILSAWARHGHTTIVNLEKLDNDRITLTLEDVPERMALDVILRSAAGFVAIPRAIDETGVSRIARIIILPRSGPSVDTARTAPVEALPAEVAAQDGDVAAQDGDVAAQDGDVAATSTEPTSVERLFGPDGQPIPDDQDDLDPSNQPAPAADDVEPAPADELRPDGSVIPAEPR